MSVSADGYIAGPDGSIDWTVPSRELHRFHNERTAATDAHLLGRRLYETMLVWDTERFSDPARRSPRSGTGGSRSAAPALPRNACGAG